MSGLSFQWSRISEICDHGVADLNAIEILYCFNHRFTGFYALRRELTYVVVHAPEGRVTVREIWFMNLFLKAI